MRNLLVETGHSKKVIDLICFLDHDVFINMDFQLLISKLLHETWANTRRNAVLPNFFLRVVFSYPSCISTIRKLKIYNFIKSFNPRFQSPM